MMQDLKFRCYKKLYVSDSSISGKGLFASEHISSGDIIFTFGGVLARLEDRYSGKYLASSFAGISENILICEAADSQKDFSDYINHSCNPNIGMDDCLTVVAIDDINSGDELTCDYAFWEADKNWRLKSICNCGSSNCRKAITGMDWKGFSIQSKSYRYCSPFIQRRIINEQGI